MTVQKFKTVEEFFESLDEGKRAQVEALRSIILDADPDLAEHIKWNAPSYVWKGEDRITFNLLNKENVVKLVLHMGATRKEDKNGEPVFHDETGLIEWNSDIRGMLKFKDLEDIEVKHDVVTQLIKKWLENPRD